MRIARCLAAVSSLMILAGCAALEAERAESPISTGEGREIVTDLSAGYQENVELINGTLRFNRVTGITQNDRSLYHAETARLEEWDAAQVETYLGTSFTPAFVPDDLMLYQGDYRNNFISRYEGDNGYWTVAYEGDTLVLDTFGFYYSASVDDTYDPLRRELLIEVTRDKLPVQDAVYVFAEQEASTVGECTITVGRYRKPYGSDPNTYADQYVAEFMEGSVGYHVWSANLTQEEFIRVLLSLPVFQKG